MPSWGYPNGCQNFYPLRKKFQQFIARNNNNTDFVVFISTPIFRAESNNLLNEFVFLHDYLLCSRVTVYNEQSLVRSNIDEGNESLRSSCSSHYSLNKSHQNNWFHVDRAQPKYSCFLPLMWDPIILRVRQSLSWWKESILGREINISFQIFITFPLLYIS